MKTYECVNLADQNQRVPVVFYEDEQPSLKRAERTKETWVRDGTLGHGLWVVAARVSD